jgi:hypothetical protein
MAKAFVCSTERDQRPHQHQLFCTATSTFPEENDGRRKLGILVRGRWELADAYRRQHLVDLET